MCSRILWLDHGKQVLFSSDVRQACDAYEMFLQNKKVPRNEKEITAAAAKFRAGELQKAKDAARRKQQEAEAFLTGNCGGNAVDLALEILKKHSPESLIEELR